jgi:hypothetical protein
MSLRHVHVTKQDDGKYCLLVGPYKSLVGYQTAEAAGLDVITRDGKGFGLNYCLHKLSHKRAVALAVKLDAWLIEVGAFEPRGKSSGKKSVEISSKYSEAMGVKVNSVKSLPRTVDDETFARNMEASGTADGSRFLRGRH